MDSDSSYRDPSRHRTQLFQALNGLTSPEFGRLLYVLQPPAGLIPDSEAPQMKRVKALLDWAEGSTGRGTDEIWEALAQLQQGSLSSQGQAFPSFQPYLQSITTQYEKWWEHYTLTDVEGKVKPPKPEQPSVFDFGLMVQTVAKEKDSPALDHDSRSEHREKIERLPVLEGIRKYADGHVLLVGRPGSGKSTALIRLLLEEASSFMAKSPDALTPSPSPKVKSGGQERIPVLVELRYWQGSIEGLIQGFLKRHGLMLDDAALSAQLGEGRFLLLVDGLNELPTEEARTQLSAFRRSYPHGPMIFTTRDLGLGGDLGIEKKLEMQPLTETQMKAFIRAYVPNQAEAMLRQLNHRLRDFGQTPLLLWMLCEVFQQSPNQQLPNNLAEVFRAFTTMYEDSSVRKHEVALLKGDVRPLSDRRLWKSALMTLAARMMQGETLVDFRVAIHRTEAERELGKIFAKEQFPVRDILDDLLKYHLLQNRTTDQLEFRHQLIQEYYAAEHLLRLLPGLSDDDLKRDYLNLLKWTEPIALMLALVDDESQALRVVKLAIDDVDLVLGARLAGNVKAPLQSATITWIDTLDVPILLKIDCWAASHSEVATNGLLKTLKDPDSAIRRSSARALENMGNETAITGLLKALEDSDASVRWSAAKALGKIGEEVAIDSLLKALQDQNCKVRWRVAEVLGKIGNEAATSGLLKALEDSDYKVRKSAAEALGNLGNEAIIGNLLKALEDQNSSVRRRAAETLGNLGSEVATRGLLKALEHQDSDIRRRATVALGNLGSKTATSGLIKALEDHDLDVRRRAAAALGKINSDAAIAGLLKALEDYDSDVRRRAAVALGNLGSKTAISGLLKALEDHDFEVRRRAAVALGKIGDEAAIGGLRKALRDQDSDVRRRAAAALETLDREATTNGLLKALEDHSPDVRVRRRAIAALGNLGSEAAIDGLLKALEDHDFDVRWRAAVALGKLGNKMAINNLITALEHQSFHARWSAAKVLEKINAESILPHLLQIYIRQPEHYLRRTISIIQNRFEFYNYAIWQESLTAQNMIKEPQEEKTSPVSKIFPNATEVKIFERVEHYYENPPDSGQ